MFGRCCYWSVRRTLSPKAEDDIKFLDAPTGWSSLLALCPVLASSMGGHLLEAHELLQAFPLWDLQLCIGMPCVSGTLNVSVVDSEILESVFISFAHT